MKNRTLSALFFLYTITLSAQTIDMDSALAEESFRNGVNALHNGFLNKAYVSFEQALSRKPSRQLYSYWLAESYYRNGYSSAATEIWQQLIEQGYEVDLLTSRVEQVRRMIVPNQSLLNIDYAVSMEISGSDPGMNQFAGPVSVCPDLGGGLFATSYITGEILHFNANARIAGRAMNGILPFNRIFDLYPADDGTYFATEFGSDRIIRYSADLSTRIGSFGSTGRGEEQFNGPQFITQDSKGYLYISDVGNGRVSKYTREGEFILSFGSPRDGFSGFSLPTGLASAGNIILAADQRDRVIYLFDESGNYLGEAGRGKFKAPEGMTKISDTEFLVADGKRLVLFDLELESVNEVTDLNGMAKRIVKAGIDLNGNIVLSDFNRNSIYYLTDRSLIYSGLYIQVEHVINDQYPKVSIDFTVKDALGRPFCGLDRSNFLLVEQGDLVEDMELVYTDGRAEEVSVAMLMDRSPVIAESRDSVEEALQTFFGSLMKGDYFSLISEEQQPLMQQEIWFKSRSDVPRVEDFFESVFSQKHPADENGRFDLGVRESVNRLLNRRGKKAIVYLTDGELDGDDFSQYNLTRIENFLKNNQILFYYVQMVPEKGSGIDDLEYLARKSGGKGLSIFSPTGVNELIPDLRKSRNGRYVLQYRSNASDGYGRNYLDISLEATHFNRTGRTLFGYYAPLDFGG